MTMAQNLITAHYGEDHVSAHEAALIQAKLYGNGRYRVDGLNLTVPNPFTLHIDNGIALIDGRWYLVTGGGESLEIPPGSLGMNRKDRVFITYERGTDGIESPELEYVVGTPTTGRATAPVNQYPASLFDQPSRAWIPYAEIPLSGFTVGTPTILMESRAVTPPANQCAECSSMMAEIQSELSDSRAATAAAWEVVRSVPAALAAYDQRIADIEELVADKIDLMGRQIRQLAAMLANNIAAYVLVGDTLAVPTAWIDYDEETGAAKFQYTSFDEETGKLNIDMPLTIDERVEESAAKVDYLLMMNGEE